MKKTQTYSITINPLDQTEMIDAQDVCEISEDFHEQPDYQTRIYHYNLNPEEVDIDLIIDKVQSLQWLLNRLHARNVKYKIRVAPVILQALAILKHDKKIKFFPVEDNTIF